MNEIVRYAELEKILGIGRVTIWRRVKNDPSFPRPVRLGGEKTTAVGFIKSEVESWLSAQMTERNIPKDN